MTTSPLMGRRRFVQGLALGTGALGIGGLGSVGATSGSVLEKSVCTRMMVALSSEVEQINLIILIDFGVATR